MYSFNVKTATREAAENLINGEHITVLIMEKIMESLWSADAECSEMILEGLVGNCVEQAMRYNHSRKNWIARDLFAGLLKENEIAKLFDEE